jgi:release factor glutamine methyltransferase
MIIGLVHVLTLPGVPAPGPDARLLADVLREQTLPPRARVLELCAGSGVLALTAAQRGAVVTAVDVAHRAALSVRATARVNGLRVRVLRGDLYAPVAGERFDLVVAAPPADRVLLDRIVAGAPDHLRTGGTLLLVHPAAAGTDHTLAAFEAVGLEGDVVARRRGAHGPQLSARVKGAAEHADDVVAVRGRFGLSPRTPAGARADRAHLTTS